MITDCGRFDVSSSRAVSKKQLQQHNKVTEEVALTSTAATSSLGSQVLPHPGGEVVPPPIAAVDTRDVQLWSEEMPGDDLYGRKQRVLILMSDTGGGHRASAEVRQPVTIYTNYRYSSSGLSSSRHVLHLADANEKTKVGLLTGSSTPCWSGPVMLGFLSQRPHYSRNIFLVLCAASALGFVLLSYFFRSITYGIFFSHAFY